MPVGGTPDPTRAFWLDWNLSYFPDAYGPIYGGHSVQQAMYNTLQKWLPTYIEVLNRHTGADLQQVKTYDRPIGYRPHTSGIDAQIDVIVPGTVGDPQQGRTNVNGISSVWSAELSVFVYAGTNWQETLALTYAYGAAARAAIVQHGGLEGFAQSTNWKGDAYFKGEPIQTRWQGIATIHFEVYVSPTIDQFAGPPSTLFAADGTPTEPTLFSIPNFPEVVEANTEVENQAIGSEEPSPI